MNESIIFIGIAFWLVYFAQTFEDKYIKNYLKVFSSGVVFICAYIPLYIVNKGSQSGFYETFVLFVGNGIIFFWVLLSLILFIKLLRMLQDVGRVK